MEPEHTRASLLSRVRDPADSAAWREFDARYRELIVRYGRARGLQPADAEDVRQLVMFQLSKSLRSFEYQPSRGRFRSYLGRAVQNAVSDFFLRPNRDVRPLDSNVMATEPGPDDGSDEAWELEWMDHHYRLAMTTIRATFDAKSVDAFDRLLEGEPVETVADKFDMSTQAVHKVKQRIRNRMKELIQRQIREEDESV